MKKSLPFYFYFVYFAAMAAMIPFVVVYYQSLGFSGFEIGMLTGISPLLALVGGPFLTGLSDATRQHKRMLIMSCTVAVIAGILFPFLRAFWPLIVLIVLYAFLTAPAPALSDLATMTMLGDDTDRYGRVRVGGTIGWMISAPLVGMLVQKFSISLAFWSYAAFMLLALILALRFQFPRSVHQTEKQAISMRAGTRILLSSRRWLLFLALALVCGTGLAVMNNFFYSYMNELKASSTLSGLGLGVANLCELPVLFFSNRLIKRFGSYGLLLFGLGGTIVRLLLYASLRSPEAVVVSQLMNGLTFPVFWVGGVAYAYEHAPEGMAATGQGLLGAMIFGIGAAAGNLLGGLLLGSMGAQKMYLVFALIVLGGTLAVLTAQRLLPAEKASPSSPAGVP